MTISFPSVSELCPIGLTGFEVDLQGWHSDSPFFASVIEKVKPEIIIEVGTWKGCSALHMAKLTENPDLSPTSIFCVDTWLGGIDHLLNQDLPQNDLKRDPLGNPRIYEQFLHNVAATPYSDRIYPIRQSSLNGARLLGSSDIAADLIYIDASHEYDDVYLDLIYYWDILAPGGIMIGDDFQFAGVRVAVQRFCFERRVAGEISDDKIFWKIQKP